MYKKSQFIEIAFLIATCLYFNTESILIRVENIFIIYFWYLIIKNSLKFNDLFLEDNGEILKKPRKRIRLTW